MESKTIFPPKEESLEETAARETSSVEKNKSILVRLDNIEYNWHNNLFRNIGVPEYFVKPHYFFR